MPDADRKLPVTEVNLNHSGIRLTFEKGNDDNSFWMQVHWPIEFGVPAPFIFLNREQYDKFTQSGNDNEKFTLISTHESMAAYIALSSENPNDSRMMSLLVTFNSAQRDLFNAPAQQFVIKRSHFEDFKQWFSMNRSDEEIWAKINSYLSEL